MTATREFPFHPAGEYAVCQLSAADISFIPTAVWNPSPSTNHRTAPYELPHELEIGIFGNSESAAKFSPPPYAVVVENENRRAALVIAADPGHHLWNQSVFSARRDGSVTISADLEGHSSPAETARHMKVLVITASASEPRVDILDAGLRAAYPATRTGARRLPDWWHRPIYCGWGDQVSTSLWLEGPGLEARALAYCTQGLYERWLGRLDEIGVPVGTVIIDSGWSPAGSWETDTTRWPDLPGFISRQHEQGRRVLLWIATWLWDGLPDDWCVFADDIKLTADPTHPSYRAFIENRVHELLSPDHIDADGFKIDQLAYSPCERRPRGGARFGATSYYDAPEKPIAVTGDGWGCELLYKLQKHIYSAAKRAKADALITSSTVHPYFHDTFDMIRLHDTGLVTGDVLDAMKLRADLAKAALPAKPIDTDDWVHSDYDRWLEYTVRSRTLGVPCLFYAERFVQDSKKPPLTKLIPEADLATVADAWSNSAQVFSGGHVHVPPSGH